MVRRVRRIIEAPPVRERTVVRVVNASEVSQCKPAFLMGVYRSGTTLLRYILDSHPNIAAPPETHFMKTVVELWKSEWNKKGLLGVGVDEEELRFRLRAFAGGILDDYAAAKGKRRWIDKTPSYIDILGFINDIFGPQTRYIMLYRHGLDVATSLAKAHEANTFAGPIQQYADRYRESTRLAFLQYWADQCDKMVAFEEIHPEKCHRIHYEQFALDPKQYLPGLFEFLDEPWSDKVLKFASESHDFGLQDYKILETQGFKPSVGNYRNWKTEELAQANEIAGSVLAKLGYKI